LADKEHAQHPVEPDERDRQVRGAGHEVDDIGRQPVGSPRRLVGEGGHEARQHPPQAFPVLRGVGLDHELRRAGHRHLEERAAVVAHDAVEQPESAPEPRRGVAGRAEALGDVVERAGDRPEGVRGVWGARRHRARVFFAGERRATGRPAAPSG
jgi:hypothetical protein